MLTVPTPAGQATITVSAPRNAVLGPLREALTTLVISLGVLGVALTGATFLQVRLGLRPLVRLRCALAEVRAGRADRLPEEQPAEIVPLVQDLNALFAENKTNLERARRHVANLAHALKTPLATLALALADPKVAIAPDTLRLIDGMDQRIRHHLGRARIAALGGPARTRIIVSGSVDDILLVLRKANADKPLTVVVDVAPDLAIACEQQDFDEIAGNILENAFKWAETAVRVSARQDGARTVAIFVEDDGPGLTHAQAASMMQPGRRLDESVPGFGFGLPIARELVELYGGSIELDRASLGGLQVTARLPLAGEHVSTPATVQGASVAHGPGSRTRQRDSAWLTRTRASSHAKACGRSSA